MEKILVTGGAGYKCTILIPKLLEKGYKVTLFDRFMWGYSTIFHFASNNNLRIIKGDIRDKSLIKEISSKVHFITHDLNELPLPYEYNYFYALVCTHLI